MTDPESDGIEGMWDDAMADAFATDPPDSPTVGDDPPSVLVRLEERLGGAPERVHLPDDLIDDETQVIAPNAPELEGGRRVGRYLLLGELARGGMGVVLHGRDTDLGRDVAIKVMRDKYCDQPVLIQRFVEEAQVAGQLQHPGVIPVYEMGLDASRRPFFSMKLVRGRTLQSLLHDRRDLGDDAPRMLQVFEQICQTLAYAHARRVVHRDLKPANVMVGAFGEVQVMDWGMAKVLSRGGMADEGLDAAEDDQSRVETVRSDGRGSQSLAGSVLGTPSYMPPEQAKGLVSMVDERADVFALGGILCEILTGHPPYVRKPGSSTMNQAQAASLEPALDRLNESAADPELIALAKHCLEPDLRDRPRDASAVTRAIADYLAGTERRAEEARVEARAAKVKMTAERQARRLTLALAVAAIGLVVLVGGGLWWAQNSRQEERVRNDREVEELILAAERDAATEGWREAARALSRARAMVDRRPTSAPTSGRIDAVEARIEALRIKAEARARRKARQAALVATLREVRNQPAEDPSTGDEEYAAAFRAYGIDVGTMSAQEIARKIEAEGGTVAETMVSALDDWAGRRRLMNNADWQTLVQAARAADDDVWRRRVRDALLADEASQLLALASDARVGEQASSSLTLLGIGLFREAGTRGREAALTLLREACREHNDEYWLHQRLAVVLAGQFTLKTAGRPPRREEILAEDELREAEVHLNIALALQPDSTYNMVFLASVMLRTGRGDEATAYLEDELKRRPKDVTLEIGLASINSSLGKMDAARRLLAGKEGIPSARRAFRRIRDLGFMLATDPVVRLNSLKERLASEQDNGDLRSELARLCLHFGDAKSAGAYAFEATKKTMRGDRGEAWCILGQSQLERGDFQAAMIAFEAARDAGDPRMMVHDLLRLSRRLEDQSGEFRRMLDSGRYPRIPELRMDIARFATFTGRWKEAARLFKGLVDQWGDRGGGRRGPPRDRGPRHPDFWFEAGLAAVMAEDIAFARTCLERCLRENASTRSRSGRMPVGVVQLHRWMHDRRIVAIREPAELARLSSEDRSALEALWKRVEQALTPPD